MMYLLQDISTSRVGVSYDLKFFIILLLLIFLSLDQMDQVWTTKRSHPCMLHHLYRYQMDKGATPSLLKRVSHPHSCAYNDIFDPF